MNDCDCDEDPVVVELGDETEDGILVGYGENEPNEVSAWLDTYVWDFQCLKNEANEAEITLPIQTLSDFLDAIGLDTSRTFYEREFCSSYFCNVWMK